MKTPAFLLRYCLMAVLLFCMMPVKAQLDDMFLSEFVQNEGAYRNQPIQVERSSYEKPVSLRQQLNTLLGIQTYYDAYVIHSYMGGMEYVAYDSVDELLDQDPVFLSYTKSETQLQRKQFEMNTSIYLHYDDANGKKCCLVLHNRPRGFLNSSVYTRTSMMMPSENKDDDYRSFHSNSVPMIASYLTAFDVKNMDIEMAKYDEIAETSIKKYKNSEKLTDVERECIQGLIEEEDVSYLWGYAEWLYKNERYYDSYTKYLNVFETLKKNFNAYGDDFRSEFYGISHKMGMSLWKLGFYDSADYYLGLASFGNESFAPDYADFGRFLDNGSKQVISELDTRISVGDALSILFDIKDGNLREAFYIESNQPVKLSNGADVWNFDLKKLCTPVPSNLVIAYSRTHYENNDSNSVDKSVLYYENNIIISSVRVDDKRWRINILIPNFRSSDYKKPGDRLNIPLSASFIVGSDGLASIKLGKKKKFYSALKEGMDQSHALKSESRILESLILLKQMHQAVSQKPDSELSQERLNRLYAEILFEIGFHLTELNQPTKALSYLAISMKQMPSTDTMSEYISVLSNIVDPRCMDIVKSEIDKQPTDSSYANFLDRRYAYLLIEYRMLDEAELILKRLLEVPGNESFARKELDYIESLRKKE